MGWSARWCANSTASLVTSEPASSATVAGTVGRLVDSRVHSLEPVRGGDICAAYRVCLGDGRTVFAKLRPDPPATFFWAEAAGLARLAAVDGGVPVPSVLGYDTGCLVLEWVEPGPPSAVAAERLGRALAGTHRAGADVFGSTDGDGWIADLTLPGGPWHTWVEFWAEGRILPFLRAAVDLRAVPPAEARDIERVLARLPQLAGPVEPAALIHGDLWAGNVLWGSDGLARLVDPAVHGGHRETDLAMLALFGLPFLDRLLAAYNEQWPLLSGWQARVPLHQLHPVLVHAVLFGGSYGTQAGRLARTVLRSV
jgi:fructosamine-3-kinase